MNISTIKIPKGVDQLCVAIHMHYIAVLYGCAVDMCVHKLHSSLMGFRFTYQSSVYLVPSETQQILDQQTA